MKSLVSIDIFADLGLLKKPDINENLYLTFQYLHKPALLGIFGAILGLDGYAYNKVPQYVSDLGHILLGIEPLQHDRGNYCKIMMTYTNTVGYANKDGNLIITEQLLVKPSARCYILLDHSNPVEDKLFLYLQQQRAEYLPYWGKNDFPIWWDNFQTYDFVKFAGKNDFKITTLFFTEKNIKDQKVDFSDDLFAPSKFPFICFEMLPLKFDGLLRQYHYERFVFTDYTLKPGDYINNLYCLENSHVIQLF